MSESLEQLLPKVIEIAKQAGDAILNYHGGQAESLKITRKKDKTLLTEADLKANQIVIDGLQKLTPDIPILSEESIILPFTERQTWQRYWLVDPLDGTRGFVEGCDEFTVNIALIDQHLPILGVIYAPALHLCYYATQDGAAFKQVASSLPVSISTSTMHWANCRIVLGRYLSKTVLLRIYQSQHGAQIERVNSSLKFCWLAEGKADLYPRLGETGEWDSAAGQCILVAAGGVIVDLEGEPLQYNTKASVINPPFVALGDPSSSAEVRKFINEKRRNL